MSDLALPPYSLDSLRAEHLALLKAWPELGTQKVGVERATALSEFACLLGEKLEDPVDRDAAQGIVDYWTAALASVPGQSFPDLRRLLPFNADYPAQVVSRARSAYEGLDRRQKEMAKTLLLALHRRDPRALEGGPEAQDVRRLLLDAKVLVPTPAGEVEIADEKLLVREWPELGYWIADDVAIETQVERFRQAERLWKFHDRKPVNLLSGAALREARRYIHRAPDIADFVNDSGRRLRNTWIVRGLVALSVAALAGLGVWQILIAREAAGLEARAATVAAEAQARQDARVVAQQTFLPSFPGEVSPGVPREAGNEEPRGLTGVILIGGSNTSLLIDDERKQPVSPRSVQAGQQYFLRADQGLQPNWPTPDYAVPPPPAFLRARTKVEVTAPPRAYARPTGEYRWARVRQILNVEIRYTDRDERRARAWQARLQQLGYTVVLQRTAQAIMASPTIGYADDVDASLARRLNSDIGALRRSAGLQPFACESHTSAWPGQFIIWVDFRPPAERSLATGKGGRRSEPQNAPPCAPSGSAPAMAADAIDPAGPGTANR